VLEEHREALGHGIHAIPALIIPGQEPVVGAVPYAELSRVLLSGGAG
jgi:predicted DsbA family dithiol-disulfide isomerase